MSRRSVGKGRYAAVVWGVIMLSGCQTQEPTYSETISFSAGDAIAANTVMQMVDPWPKTVRNSNLATPADLDQYRPRPQGGGETTESALDGGMTTQ